MLFMRHFAISAENFSICTLVLQKQHSFKRKRHKNEIRTILHTYFKLRHIL